ncbi:MAG: membrane trafficking protein [Bacillota bacterium]|nr:membrane trafficking protein [Bacillota bacterium]
MNDAISKKLAEMLGKMDEKILQAKLNAAIDMLKKGNPEDLAKKINKLDKNEIMNKLNELDTSKLNEFNIDKEEIRKRINSADFEKMSQILGENGDEIINKLKDIIK